MHDRSNVKSFILCLILRVFQLHLDGTQTTFMQLFALSATLRQNNRMEFGSVKIFIGVQIASVGKFLHFCAQQSVVIKVLEVDFMIPQEFVPVKVIKKRKCSEIFSDLGIDLNSRLSVAAR